MSEVRTLILDTGESIRTYFFGDDDSASVAVTWNDTTESVFTEGSADWARENLAFHVSIGYREIVLD